MYDILVRAWDNVTHKQIVMYDILVRAQDNQAVTKMFVSLLLNAKP